MRRQKTAVLALVMSSFLLSGCALVAGGVAGGVAASEIEEDDGQFDPGENTDIGRQIYN